MLGQQVMSTSFFLQVPQTLGLLPSDLDVTLPSLSLLCQSAGLSDPWREWRIPQTSRGTPVNPLGYWEAIYEAQWSEHRLVRLGSSPGCGQSLD